MQTVSGVFAPVTTPFDSVTGEIDLVALRSNVRRLLGSELSGVVLFGSTGEGPLVDEEERVVALEALRSVVGDKLLLAGVAAESTRQAIRRARAAASAGADAVMIAPPSYFMPQLTPEALREHFLAVADASPVPVLVYQVPPVYSGADLRPGLVAELSRHGNVAGIKDSTGDLHAMGELVEWCSRDFAVIAGNGAAFYGSLEVGAVGGILAVANLAPSESAQILKLKREGRDAEAGAIQERLSPLHKTVVGGFGVPGVKAALDLLGLSGGPPRDPLRALKEKEVARVREALRNAGVLGG